MKNHLQIITEEFSLEGSFIDAIPFGSGHINDTFLVATSSENYILQRLNHNVFKDIEKMNKNIILALNHLSAKRDSKKNNRFRKLNIILCNNGNNHFKDKDGNYWRMMTFIAESTSFDVVENPEIAFEAAKAYGYFQRNLLDLNPTDFHPVIKDFHNLEMRMNAFFEVSETNPAKRMKLASNEINFVKSHSHLSRKLNTLLESNEIPIRVTHNDTKINNVLLNKESLKGIAVIDLDTIMPGTILFDFGDMVRTFTSPAEEDEINLTKVVFRTEIFKALAEGYLSELKDVLTKNEINNLVFGGKVMTFMIGLRFLTDFLEGDVYFKTARENHNLDRCRTQFKLLSEIEKQEDVLEEIINNI
jgi:hypothetical protein